MRSLWLKLMAAFVLVILIGAVVDALLVSRTTSGQFNRYVTQSGQAWVQQLAPLVAEHYANNGSWEGVEALLVAPWSRQMVMANTQAAPTGADTMGRGMMHGYMMTEHGRMGMTAGNMWAAMGIRLLVADAQGLVVADTASTSTGTALDSALLAAGAPVLVNDQAVGTLLAIPMSADVVTPASTFLSAVTRSTWLASLAAGGVALLFGLLVFRQIVMPIRTVTAAAQRIAAGQLEQHVPVTSQDEIGRLAAAFNQMVDALAYDQQLRRTMIADIAHELRTPLSVIQANLEAMLDGVLPADPQEIASLHDEATLLARLVADLRLLSLADAGQLKLEHAPTDLGKVIEKVVAHLQLQAETHGVTIATEVSPTLPLVAADADRIGQVLGNLLSNALRYTPTGGRITVCAFAEVERNTESVVVVEVTDTGSGIAPADLPYVFDRFYRADKSRTRTSGGSGLGLAIVKQLVEAHGGYITAQPNMAGQGVTFTFTLPVLKTQ